MIDFLFNSKNLFLVFFLFTIQTQAVNQTYYISPDQVSLPSGSSQHEIEFVRWSETEKFVKNFSELPSSGNLDRTPWSDSNWPEYRGGITWRWYNPTNIENNDFEYFYAKKQTGENYEWDYSSIRAPLSKKLLQSMSPEQIANLSPAEKFDALTGNYSEGDSLTEFNIDNFDYSTLADPWGGFCGGWSAASLHYEQPGPVEITNPDGVVISFGSSDIKALLTYFFDGGIFMQQEGGITSIMGEVEFEEMGGIMKKLTVMVGEDCRLDEETCGADLTPGQFHLLLTNLVGLQKKGFVVDVNSQPNQYFQPLFHFSSKVESIQGKPLFRKITTEIQTSVDLLEKDIPSFDPSVENHFSYTEPSFEKVSPDKFRTQTIQYSYIVELDQNGDIKTNSSEQVWLSDNRPDSAFMWQKPNQLGGPFKALESLYKASLK